MNDRIVTDPEVCGGRPIVAGTRMRVSDVLDALASSASIEELLVDFPYLTREDIDACIAYDPADGPVLSLEAIGQEIARRREALGGNIDMPRNAGNRRTASKLALLKAIEDAGGKW